MRLTLQQIKVLKNSVKKQDEMAQLYLFGSRTDDNKKGGDIDLLIKSEIIDRAKIREIRSEFYQQFGEQKMDLLIQKKATKDAFIDKIQAQLVLL